jgi:pimeloyl-ACP methyl ester carboxylesterase
MATRMNNDKVRRDWGESMFRFLTNADGLTFSQEIPDRADVASFLEVEATRSDISIEAVRSNVAKRGYANYVLDELKAGHLPSSEAANLLGVHYHEFYRMAYSSGALAIPAGMPDSLFGVVTPEIEALRRTPGLTVEEVSYRSSMEDLGPLYAEVVFDPSRRRAPVMIWQHGNYPGSRLSTIQGCVTLAQLGFFALSVSKRGRDGSAGPGDVWGRETLDILDALHYCFREYADYLDPTNVTVIGQSGGGIDAMACGVRFPDAFRCVVSVAGPPDPGALIRWGSADSGNGARSPSLDAIASGENSFLEEMAEDARHFYALLRRDAGGHPDEAPDHYVARDLSRCGINNPYSQTFFVWDEQDPGAKLYQEGIDRYVEDQRRLGYANARTLVVKPGDPIRFFHWIHPDQWWFVYHRCVPHLLSGSFPEPVLAPYGRMRIPGFVRTKRFTVWLGRGDDAAALLEYDLRGSGGIFRFRRLTRDAGVRGRLILHQPGEDREIGFRLDETVIVDR